MGNLTEEEKKARKREYLKKYREKHKEEIAAYKAAYRAANKEKIAARKAEYYAAHKDEIAAYKAAYRAAHKEELAEYAAEWYATHKEELAAYDAAYRAAHKEEINAQKREYRTTPYGRAIHLVSGYDQRDKKRGFDISKNIDATWMKDNVFSGQRCIYCGEEDWTKLGIDRINNALGHVPENCVPCCGHCNIERRNKYTFEEFVKYKKAALQ